MVGHGGGSVNMCVFCFLFFANLRSRLNGEYMEGVKRSDMMG